MENTDGIYVRTGVFTPEECTAFIQRCEGIGFERATMSFFGGAVHRPDIRNNDRVILDDPSLAETIWARVGPLLPAELDGNIAIGLNECFRFYRYDPGQKFAPHVDGAYRSPTGATSILTLLLYLNAEFTGGETTFNERTITPEIGMTLAFRHTLVHAGAEIQTGRKYVLRSDVMFL